MRNNKKESKIKDIRFTRFTPMWATSSVVVSLLDYVNNNGVLKNSYNGVLHLEKIKDMVMCLTRV